MNLVHWQPKVVEPIDETFVVYLHLLVEGLGAAIDEGSRWTGSNVQQFVHVVGCSCKDHLLLRRPDIFRSLYAGLLNNFLFPMIVSLLRLLVDDNVRIVNRVRCAQLAIS